MIIPLLFLAKDGVPAVSVCVQQFRTCPRLVDSASNPPMPGGAPFPAPPPH